MFELRRGLGLARLMFQCQVIGLLRTESQAVHLGVTWDYLAVTWGHLGITGELLGDYLMFLENCSGSLGSDLG